MGYSSVTDEASVRAELQRIITSPLLADADRLVRFLTFVVEQTLAGNSSELKESVVGVEVFGRTPGYDPKTDPIVRVQARRLRAKLDAWYQDGGQGSAVRIALPKGGYAPEFAASQPVPAEPVRESPPVPMPVTQPRRSWIWLAPIVGLLLVGTGAAILTNWRASPTAPGSRIFTAFPGYQTNPAFSPDGLTLAFSWGGGTDNGKQEIYVQPLRADEPRRLTASTVRERNPVWLPDGRHIGFLRDDGADRLAVMVAPVVGEGERRVAEIAADLAAPPRIDWSRDGRKIYTSEAPAHGDPAEVVEIDLQSGARRWVSPPAKRGPAAAGPFDDDVHLSPDGKWLAFRRRIDSSVGDVFIAPVTGGQARAITHDHTGIAGLAWTKDGQSVVVSSQRQSGLVRLWRFPLNGRAPACLTDAALSASFPAVSPRDGQIAFSSRYLNANIWRIDLRRETPPQMIAASNLLDSCPRFSPQGDRIAFRSNRTGSDEIWMADEAGHSAVRLTTLGGPVTGSPRWSPDGQYLAFDSRPDGSADVFLIPAGGGPVRRMTVEASNEITPAFSSDGRYLYFASDRTGIWQVWKQSVDGGTARQVTAGGGFAPQESADGHWLYYAKPAGDLYRVPVTGGAESVVLQLPGGSWGGWALSGNKVIYATLAGDHDAAQAELRTFDPQTGKREVVTSLQFPPVQWDGSVGVSPDGRYALVTEVRRQGSEIHLQPER